MFYTFYKNEEINVLNLTINDQLKLTLKIVLRLFDKNIINVLSLLLLVHNIILIPSFCLCKFIKCTLSVYCIPIE